MADRPNDLSTELIEKVNQVRSKFDDIHQDLAVHVTKIYDRPELMISIDLVFHSVLSFNFLGNVVRKGWLECLILGDTGCGKTATVGALIKHYKAGDICTGEGATFAGIVGGAQQFAGNWSITWGQAPLMDRRLLAIDEVSGLTTEMISNMSGMRSDGIAALTKIHQEKTFARTRLIWISNPRGRNKGLRAYNTGIEAVQELIGRPEDVRRFDFAVTVAKDNKIGLDQHLSMEGMVSRIVTEPSTNGYPHVNTPALDENIFRKYQYRSLTDDAIYKPPNTLKLVTNYFIGFAQLCERYVTMGEKENAVRAAHGAIDNTSHDLAKRLILYRIMLAGKITDDLQEFLDEEMNSPDFVEGHEGLIDERLQVASLLEVTGESEKADVIVGNERDRLNLKNSMDKLRFGTQLLNNSLDRHALELLTQLTVEDSTNVDIWKAYAAALYTTGNHEEMQSVLDRMKKLAPGDKSVEDIINILNSRNK